MRRYRRQHHLGLRHRNLRFRKLQLASPVVAVLEIVFGRRRNLERALQIIVLVRRQSPKLSLMRTQRQDEVGGGTTAPASGIRSRRTLESNGIVIQDLPTSPPLPPVGDWGIGFSSASNTSKLKPPGASK